MTQSNNRTIDSIRLFFVVGTRPNFVKAAALFTAINRRGGFAPFLIHTGQHYDDNMSRVFFSELGLPKPNIDLEIAGGSYVSQTCRIMEKMEELIAREKPAAIIVVGDVNSTLAASLAAMQTGTRLAHVEAGLRSFDRTMPEELNRIIVDHIADYLFVTEQAGIDNLLKEGIPREKIFFAGNVMVDTLKANIERAKQIDIRGRLGLPEGPYALATLHRPANADNPESLADMLETLSTISREITLVLPLHPRTGNRIEGYGLKSIIDRSPGMIVTEPLGYLDFLAAMAGAAIVLTDSGGIQEETTILGVPCVTMRDNTERPVTVETGSNILAGTKGIGILAAFRTLRETPKATTTPPLWDGNAAGRILDILETVLTAS